MAEKKVTAKKATETKAAAAKKETVKKALRQLQRQFSLSTLRMLVSRQEMFIRHWQQPVRHSP